MPVTLVAVILSQITIRAPKEITMDPLFGQKRANNCGQNCDDSANADRPPRCLHCETAGRFPCPPFDLHLRQPDLIVDDRRAVRPKRCAKVEMFIWYLAESFRSPFDVIGLLQIEVLNRFGNLSL
ncbi:MULTISPECIES: hypothetical protein [Salipiger]|uniref:hypothetical protein n=1 Tax=Salipiger TaxID=263377 RepID=UPI003516D049